ncbi:galactitol-1-phosphate 5-dehydrogenase [Shouchella shacheensis]|uniref:galactitol-1-phosphate 5-dehydrogenase n=1 Tax=Shouchella shacheensis TaxID=1649580 RepID=UPI00073FE3F4|nr:galactitol-1-phosphate 5-dehydrogenase [Shouchella shacheensis]
MEALNLYDIQDIRYEESPKPEIEHENEVLIKVMAAGICGSDLSRYKKLGPYVSGMTFGHEFAGVVVEVGSGVEAIQLGDRVAACPTFHCGVCESCQKGEPSRCEALTVIGARHSGAFASYVKLPARNVISLPTEIDYDTAALIEPSAVVAHGFYRTSIQPGAEVAVMGCGSIGLLAIQWARIFGAKKVYAIDIDEAKLAVAKEVGADVLINSLEGLAHDQIHAKTNGAGVDVAIESAGSPITSAQVLALPKKGGEVVFMGIPYGDVNVERFYFEKIVRNELTVYGSWNALSVPFPGKEWSTTVHYMATGELSAKPMITHRLSMSEGPKTFKEMTSGAPGYVKTLFYPA